MIGKSEWFSRRKYGGWGLVPKTWQGWVYIAIFIAITIGLQHIPGISGSIQTYLLYGLTAVVCLDVLHIMATLKKDELEVKIEALAERNAAWVMIVVIAIGIVYQTAQSTITGQPEIDWFLIATIGGGLIAKALTNFWLEHKGL